MLPSGSAVQSRRLLLSNRAPVFGWIFALMWLGALALGTPAYLESRPSAELGYGDIFMGCLWAFGAGAAAFFLRVPRTTVHVDRRDVVVTERWLLATREHRCTRADAERAVVTESTDTDGLPYFVCRLTTSSGRVFTIAEGHQRDAVDRKRRMLHAAFAPEIT